MHAKSVVAGALLAATPMVQALGSTTISNKCNFPVYLWTVTNEASAMKTINNGDEYTEGYLTNPDGGGVSMKLATSPTDSGAVTQFEYTLDSTLWYDISNINGSPFMQWGTTLVPSESSCRSVLCAAGVTECSQAYNTPDQNWATAACSSDADMTLVLCSGQDNESTPSPLALNVHNEHHHKKHHHHHHDTGAANVNLNVNANPAPAPAATPAPAPAPAAAAGPLTTFVTNIVTVTARNAEPSVAAEQPVRRHMHQHHHHHHA